MRGHPELHYLKLLVIEGYNVLVYLGLGLGLTNHIIRNVMGASLNIFHGEGKGKNSGVRVIKVSQIIRLD